VLRYGTFYGPGTSIARGGEQFELVRRRKFPLVGDGGGVWSFIHFVGREEIRAGIERLGEGLWEYLVQPRPATLRDRRDGTGRP
jgi:hypothetical protein